MDFSFERITPNEALEPAKLRFLNFSCGAGVGTSSDAETRRLAGYLNSPLWWLET